MWEKIKSFLKKYWGVVLSAVGFAVGFIIGRKQSVSGLDGLVAELRAEIERLGEEVGQLRADNARLARLNEHDQAELRRIEEELGRARNLVDEAGREIADGRADTEGLAEGLSDLRGILARYREDLEKITTPEHHTDR